MQILKIRAKLDLDQEELARELGVASITIARIEKAERDGEKHRVSLRMANKITEALSGLLKSPVVLEDLEGVTLAPPRPGRPKRGAR